MNIFGARPTQIRSHSRQLPKVVVGIIAFSTAWLLALATPSSQATRPDTTSQFSLDLDVTATVDHGLIYAVEQRARPDYRIFSFDPRTGATETTFTVPADAIIFGIALSPDRASMAIAYSTDFRLRGNGVSILDLETDQLHTIIEPVDDVYFSELAWEPGGTDILATRIDRSGDDEELSIVTIDSSNGSFIPLANNALSPTGRGDDLFFLEVDDNKARSAIGHSLTGVSDTIEVGEGSLDLDHLLTGANGRLVVSAIESDSTSIEVGTPASAHGNHDVPATWWTVSTAGSTTTAQPIGYPPAIVHDAYFSDGAIIYATNEGLSIATDKKYDVIASRAIRFVTG